MSAVRWLRIPGGILYQVAVNNRTTTRIEGDDVPVRTVTRGWGAPVLARIRDLAEDTSDLTKRAVVPRGTGEPGSDETGDAWSRLSGETWEEIASGAARRIRVPGGYLYQVAVTGSSTCSSDDEPDASTAHEGWTHPAFVSRVDADRDYFGNQLDAEWAERAMAAKARDSR